MSDFEYESGVPRISTRGGHQEGPFFAQDGEELYTFRDLARLCEVSENTIRPLAKELGLVAENPNRGLVSFFRKHKVAEFLQKRYGS